MPNWVYNHIQIEGERAEIDAFLTKAKDGGEYARELGQGEFLTFHAFITPPAGKVEEYHETNGSKPDGNGGFIRTGDTEFNWYNWNNKNWQTKWDACEQEIVTNEDDTLIFQFATAWSPPEPVFTAMAEAFPKLSFFIEYEEEQGWGGKVAYYNGEITDSEEWDIPNSHADYEERGRECDACVGWHPDEPEEWYDDCPDKAEQIAKQKMEKNMENKIIITGADTSVGEVVESFMDNHLINDETLYEVNSVDVYGIGTDWNRLTGAEVNISTDKRIDNRYIDPIREQFPNVDIEVAND